MSIEKLKWQKTHTSICYDSSMNNDLQSEAILALQPKLTSSISMLCSQNDKSYKPKFMLVKAAESPLTFSLIEQHLSHQLTHDLLGYAYHIKNDKITLSKAKSSYDNFAATKKTASLITSSQESLFGCVRMLDGNITQLQAGLAHQTNGGVLILGLRSLISQPALLTKLKESVMSGQFHWTSPDESAPLPLSIPDLPLNLQVILVGDRISIADLQYDDPLFFENAIYSEFEHDVEIKSFKMLTSWVKYVQNLAKLQNLPDIDVTAINPLVRLSTEFTEDQNYLPLSPDFLSNILKNAAICCDSRIDEASIIQSTKLKNWRESTLESRLKQSIYDEQVKIDTQGSVVGQINALTVIQYPGHPKEIGEPSRLSCLIHYGDGELIDVERKNELGGHLHAKAMMIIHAFLTAEFGIYSQLPFNASLVFEQSYNEIDGDSASLAGISVLISALSNQPIDQQIAVTGSIDQFGHVQVIGAVNEKITGFYDICKRRILTGNQGVIIPKGNINHLCLNDEIVNAIKNEWFHIWAVDNVSDALSLLMKLPYKSEDKLCLHALINTRMQLLNSAYKKPRSRLFSWFK